MHSVESLRAYIHYPVSLRASIQCELSSGLDPLGYPCGCASLWDHCGCVSIVISSRAYIRCVVSLRSCVHYRPPHNYNVLWGSCCAPAINVGGVVRCFNSHRAELSFFLARSYQVRHWKSRGGQLPLSIHQVNIAGGGSRAPVPKQEGADREPV